MLLTVKETIYVQVSTLFSAQENDLMFTIVLKYCIEGKIGVDVFFFKLLFLFPSLTFFMLLDDTVNNDNDRFSQVVSQYEWAQCIS